jgi:DivIVA domain
MRLTAMDINNKEFKKSMRGYSVDEVDEFLDKITEDYEELYRENSTLKEKLTGMNDKIDHYSKIEATIQNTLILAQNAAEQAKSSAQKEAEFILKNANETAQKILDKAHNEILLINQDYDKVKQEFIKFRAKYRNFMNAQIETFDDLEKDFVKNYNIGNVVTEVVKEKEIEEEALNLNSFSDNNFSKDDLNEIKSFFIKE